MIQGKDFGGDYFESDTSEYSESILMLEHLHSCDATLQICHARRYTGLGICAA
jgi:hypothetical protein